MASILTHFIGLHLLSLATGNREDTIRTSKHAKEASHSRLAQLRQPSLDPASLGPAGGGFGVTCRACRTLFPAAKPAPEICIEILSSDNTAKEIREKTALYFEAGAREMSICDLEGKMRFLSPTGDLSASPLFPEFPKVIHTYAATVNP